VPNFLGAEMKNFNLYKISGQPKVAKNFFQSILEKNSPESF
jgi:hypothetical protein